MIQIDDTALAIEYKLQAAFAGVTWIGEIPLTERDFRLLCSSVRASEILLVPPRLLLATMVFCARHAEFKDDEPINFWGKFFEDVLKQSRSQGAENACRAAFRRARTFVQAEHGFDFPTQETTHTEVVSGVYQHAILPAYLQDDFALFFLKQYPDQAAWATVDGLFPDQIAARNEQSPPQPPTSKRLINFIRSVDTSITAARLIKTLATAALWHGEGLTPDSIAEVLSPIERSIWAQMVPHLPKADVMKLPARSPAARVRWAWLIEQNDILELHARNIRLEGNTPPDRLVWLPDADKAAVRIGERIPEYDRRYAEVNAYHAAGVYTIDNAILIDIDDAGALVAVDEQDCALNLPVATEAPPGGTSAFFRIQPDGQLAILSELDRLTDGDYAVSLPEGVTLTAEEGGSVKLVYPLMVPKALKAQGHTAAARYTIALPVRIGDRRVDKRRSRLAPTLEGQSLVGGLVPGALPIYEAGEVALRLSPPKGVPLERLFVRVTANDEVKVYALHDLDAVGRIQRDDVGGQETLRVRLDDRLPPACLLQVEVFSGVARMHGDPRLAGVLPPGVRVIASPVDRWYTPASPPTVRIENVTEAQVECASDARIESDGGGVTVTWVDPRQDAALRLKLGGAILPLTFDVKWSFAWVSPLNGQFLWEDAVDEAVLSVRGAQRAAFYIVVAGGTPRRYELNARGTMDVRIVYDALKEMLHQYQGERALVQMWFEGSDERIDLFTFIRPQFGDFERQPEIIKGAVRAFKAHLRQGRRETIVAHAHLLPALPHEYADSVPVDALPMSLKTLRTITPDAYASARAALLPAHGLLLRVSETLDYPIDQSGTAMTIHIPGGDGRHERPPVTIEYSPAGVILTPASAPLYQCARCGGVYWGDDREAKLKHGHGMFGIDARLVSDAPINGRIVLAPMPLDQVRTYAMQFDAFIDRSVQATYRIKDLARARDQVHAAPATPFTKRAYTQATAHWTIRRSKFHVQLDARLKALYSESAWVDSVTNGLISKEDAALISAGRWVRQEWELRKADDWAMLDPVVMALAVLARAAAHGIVDLFDDDSRILTLLEHAHYTCPELLTWALTWSELIFTHWQKDSL